MREDSAQTTELWWTVALEATLFVSLPGWAFAADRAWPASHPFGFALAVLGGASLATLLCHIAPAIWARSHNIPWPIAVLFCSGAAVGFVFIAGIAAASLLIVGTCIAGSIVVAWIAPLRRVATVACLTFGLGLLILLFVKHWQGLWIENLRFSGENAMGSNLKVFAGVMWSAAPVSVLGYRIGRMGATTRQILWTGLSGIWLPSAVATVLGSLAAMGGQRMYWVPSLFGGFQWAFVPYGRYTTSFAALATFGTCLVYAMWIKELTGGWKLKWQVGGAILWVSSFAAGTFQAVTYHGPPTFRPPEFLPWCWSIILAGAAAGLWNIVAKLREGRSSSSIHPKPGFLSR